MPLLIDIKNHLFFIFHSWWYGTSCTAAAAAGLGRLSCGHLADLLTYASSSVAIMIKITVPKTTTRLFLVVEKRANSTAATDEYDSADKETDSEDDDDEL